MIRGCDRRGPDHLSETRFLTVLSSCYPHTLGPTRMPARVKKRLADDIADVRDLRPLHEESSDGKLSRLNDSKALLTFRMSSS